MNSRVRTTLIAFVAGLSVSSASYAAPVTFLFSGQVKETNLTATSVGDSFDGSFTFDDSESGVSQSSNATFYEDAISEMTFGAGSYQATADSGNILLVDSLLHNGGTHLFHWEAFNPADNIGPPLGSLVPQWLSVDIFGTFGSSFDINALPSTPPDVSDFTFTWFRFTLFDENSFSFGVISGEIDTLTAQNGGGVPVPAASALLLMGLAGLGLRRKRA